MKSAARSSLFRWAWVAACITAMGACSSAGGVDEATDTPTAGKGGKSGGAGKAGSAGKAGGSAGASAGASSEGGAAGAGAGTTFGGSGGGVDIVGGAAGSGGAQCAAVAQKADAKVLPADIIWVIDTSGSMSDEMASVQQKMNNFAGGILSVGIDVRVVLLAERFECPPIFGCNNPLIPPDGMCLPGPLGSGKCPDDENKPVYHHPDVTIGSTDGLVKIVESYPQWKDALRPDSVKFMVVVTDDDGTTAPYDPAAFPDAEQGAAKKFIDDFTALDPTKLTGFKMSGIYCFSECDPWVARPGKVWDAIVNQTKGVKGDLCKQDFQPIFNDLAAGVVASAKLSCSWQIPPPPDGQQFDPGLVNVKFTAGNSAEQEILYATSIDKCDPQKGGWYYDNPTKPTTVLACPSTCSFIQSDPNGKIDLLFGCATRPIDID